MDLFFLTCLGLLTAAVWFFGLSVLLFLHAGLLYRRARSDLDRFEAVSDGF